MSELTHVELLWIKKQFENRIRFGRSVDQHPDQRSGHHVRDQKGGDHRPTDGGASGLMQGEKHQAHPGAFIGDPGGSGAGKVARKHGSSFVTCSCVTVRITSGPVTNM